MVVPLPHVCIIALTYLSCFWASATAVEVFCWSVPDMGTSLQEQTSMQSSSLQQDFPCQGHPCRYPLGYLSLSTMCSPTRTGHGAQCHHIASASEGGFQEQGQPALRLGPHQDGCIQTHTSHLIFHLFDKVGKGWRQLGWVPPCVSWGKQSHGEMDLLPHCCMGSMWQSEELNPDLPTAQECLSHKTECLHCDDELFFRWVAKQLACSSAVIKDPKIAFHELPVALLSWVSWLQSSLAYSRLHLQTFIISAV